METLVVARGHDDRAHVDCAECGHRYGPAGADPRRGAVATEQLLGPDDGVLTRRYYCPCCALLFAVGVRAVGEPVSAERTDAQFTFPFARALNDAVVLHRD
ncbi:MAG TPA: hypothetical protein VGM91_04315 [Conexibacter sp.]|jgi:hypothetical protein